MDLIDLKTFSELQQNAGREFVTELAQTFLEEAPGMLTELRVALQAGDAPRFRRAAHSLKSNGMSFGAMPLAEAARSLELGGLPTDAAALDLLQSLYERSALRLKEVAGGR